MSTPGPANVVPIDRLLDFVERYPRLFVLTGAGCSTSSGIPDYRDQDGAWKHRPPIYCQEFVGRETARRRYWARSLVGWERFAHATPNGAHHALAELEGLGCIERRVTQNVDGLHHRAGSRRVIDLHSRLYTVECLGCGRQTTRVAWQQTLQPLNPEFLSGLAPALPDGDAALADHAWRGFRVPGCPDCGGVVKPAVTFFGECVPSARVEAAHAALRASDAVLVVGSSLMVYSGYRFCRAARDQGKPIAAVNLGRTRADADLVLKVAAPCAQLLPRLAAHATDRRMDRNGSRSRRPYSHE